MAIWKITCPECGYCEEVTKNIDDYPEKEKNEYLKERQPGEIRIKIDIHTANHIKYALDHVPTTGNEHIDGVISTFLLVLDELIDEYNKSQPKLSINDTKS